MDNGHVPDPETSSKQKQAYQMEQQSHGRTTPDVSTPGSHPGVALVHYPDGTEDEAKYQ